MYQLKKTEVTCICDNVYVLTDRAGCCVNLVVGKEKALVFDTGSGTDDIHGLVRKMTGLPLVVINSHGHFDHIGGNSQFDTVYMHQDDFVILESYTAEMLGQCEAVLKLKGTGFAAETVTSDTGPGRTGSGDGRLPLKVYSFRYKEYMIACAAYGAFYVSVEEDRSYLYM